MLSYDLTEEMALERANVIREKISQPYQIYDAQINIDACIGIVISDGESRTDYLYKCADLALYEAKKEGSGHVQIFRPGMLQRLQENKSFEDDLLQALSLLSADRRYRHARKSTAMKRWFVGSIRCAAPCRRRCLFRWQRKSVLLMPLANGC
ncbi:diguanylate cyclase/cyclic diguanylate phosphodiesterase [Klebsiella pneumoniae]|uniref:Diguanylate cyclase/cyclic diguanylate phosphodiesterase n=1 Tax=Klebsiella pneumoniae TaxID=573 RepID=A0A378ASY0_KLEPN|nr:diguanylate cyclase/cyclic diguanylate phosphodiesterase [Klebsiella pneumoniae]